jgi:hypothetical protein
MVKDKKKGSITLGGFPKDMFKPDKVTKSGTTPGKKESGKKKESKASGSKASTSKDASKEPKTTYNRLLIFKVVPGEQTCSSSYQPVLEVSVSNC